MQPIGIRPTNDFAFKKTFGSPENKVALISLLNAILTLPVPIADVTIENPYNLQDFQNDKLSILDIRAVDQRGAIYDVEMQLSTHSGLVKRIVFYGCEVYAGQLKAGDDYSKLKPVYSICLLEGQLWDDSPKVHHTFRLVDQDSGRLLAEAIKLCNFVSRSTLLARLLQHVCDDNKRALLAPWLGNNIPHLSEFKLFWEAPIHLIGHPVRTTSPALRLDKRWRSIAISLVSFP
jgi:hypothetical protein